jgi:hypothetical protein
VPSVLVVGAVQVSVAVPVAGAAATVTVALCAADPPDPVQVSVNLVVALNAAVLAEPLVASDPLQPPEAVQELALVDDQLKVEVALLCTVLGFAESVTVGAGEVTETVTDCEALPPAPVQASP